ncbi:MAG: thermitase, partial [Thermoplasmata archaeon]|nr:thermitase [Thermoplasmata archaeon]
MNPVPDQDLRPGMRAGARPDGCSAAVAILLVLGLALSPLPPHPVQGNPLPGAASLRDGGGASQSPGEDAPPVGSRVKVRFLGEIPSDLPAVVQRLGGAIALRIDPLHIVAIQFPTTARAVAALEPLRAWDGVEWAVADGLVHALGTVRQPMSPNPPTDPLWAQQYGPALIGAPAAWSREEGRAGTAGSGDDVLVAVLDTGIDASGSDLLAPCTPQCLQGPSDLNGHGTHVAGIIAAAANNGAGIVGVAHVKLLAFKALADNGFGWWTQTAAAVVDATLAGADVISMSFGAACAAGDLVCADLQLATQFAWSHGVVLVAASGNEGGPILAPASFPNVLAVGSVGPSKSVSPFSNVGAAQDLVAPGEGILSTVPAAGFLMSGCIPVASGYASCTGTSMAAPHVAGVAALLKSNCPGLSNAEIASILTGTAEDLGSPGWDRAYGHGLVRADQALGAPWICPFPLDGSDFESGSSCPPTGWEYYEYDSGTDCTVNAPTHGGSGAVQIED